MYIYQLHIFSSGNKQILTFKIDCIDFYNISGVGKWWPARVKIVGREVLNIKDYKKNMKFFKDFDIKYCYIDRSFKFFSNSPRKKIFFIKSGPFLKKCADPCNIYYFHKKHFNKIYCLNFKDVNFCLHLASMPMQFYYFIII